MNAPRARLPLRRLPRPRTGLRLVRSQTGERASAVGLLLLQGVPGLLDALGREVARLG